MPTPRSASWTLAPGFRRIARLDLERRNTRRQPGAPAAALWLSQALMPFGRVSGACWSAEQVTRTEPIEAVSFVGGESSVYTVKPTVYVRRERAGARDRRAAAPTGETDPWATGAVP